jgi:opacity protein-like surface antigen
MKAYIKSVLGVVAVAAALSSPVSAQDRAVNLFVRSGGYDAITDLNDAGTADFKKVGFNVGGGVSVDLNRYVAVRGDFNFARNELRTNGVDTGDKLNRYFYDAAVQLQYPTTSGLTPYVFAGAGGVTLDPASTTGDNETKATGTVGLGVNYALAGTGLGVFVEGRGWAFGTKDLTGMLADYDKTQFELAWSGGFSYALPF